MTKARIGDRHGYYDENGNYVTHRALTQRPPVSFSKRVRYVWHSLNKPRELLRAGGFTRGIKAIFLILLVVTSGLLIADQFLKPHFVPSVFGINWTVTNLQTLWKWGGTTGNLVGDLTEFNTNSVNLVTYVEESALAETWPTINLNSNSTHGALALTKAPANFDTIAAHQLTALLTYRFTSFNNPSADIIYGMYLTRNGTLPTEVSNYNPETDKNVAMVIRIHSDVASSASASLYWFLQRESTRAISDDTGTVRDGTGSVFLVMGFTQETAAGNLNRIYGALNYTGNQANTNALSRLSTQTGLGDTDDSTKILSWFQFQGIQYYVGFFLRATAADTTVRVFGRDFSTAAGMGGSHFARSDPAASSQQNVPQAIDTGGFFGPLIKALIGLGIWILNGIAQFLGFVANAFVTAMNAVGAFFGLGAIGTAIRDALVGVATWVANVFGTIFGQSINIATAIANALSAAVQVTGTYWTRLTSWLSALSDLLSLFWPFIAFFGIGLPFSALMTYWLIQGIIMSYNSRDGALQWIRWTWILSATLFNIMWEIGYRAFQVVLDVKRLLAQWI